MTSGDKLIPPAHPIDVYLKRLEGIESSEELDMRRKEALESIAALARHLVEQPDASLADEIVVDLRLRLIAYLHVHRVIEGLPDNLDPRELETVSDPWELVEKAPGQVPRGQSFTLDDVLGIAKPKLRGRPAKQGAPHKHERLFLMAFHDHEVVKKFRTQIAALKHAATLTGLKEYEADSLDHEYRVWRDPQRTWLCWLFDLV